MLPIGADLEQYQRHYSLSNRDYYGFLHIEHDADNEDVRTAFGQLAEVVQSDIDKGDKRAEDYLKQARTAHDILTDPIRRAQYDDDLHVQALHPSGERSTGQNSEEARSEELRKWACEEAERQRAKERSERRVRDKLRFELDQMEPEDLQAELDSVTRRKEEEIKQGVQAEKERRAEDERSRKRQTDDFLRRKLAAEARMVQAEADLPVLLEERGKKKARESEVAGLERKELADERKRKR